VSVAANSELQLRFIVDLDDHPLVGVAVGNVLLLLLEELKIDEIAVRQVRVEMDR
jgi:hypothetical protein